MPPHYIIPYHMCVYQLYGSLFIFICVLCDVFRANSKGQKRGIDSEFDSKFIYTFLLLIRACFHFGKKIEFKNTKWSYCSGVGLLDVFCDVFSSVSLYFAAFYRMSTHSIVVFPYTVYCFTGYMPRRNLTFITSDTV